MILQVFDSNWNQPLNMKYSVHLDEIRALSRHVSIGRWGPYFWRVLIDGT